MHQYCGRWRSSGSSGAGGGRGSCLLRAAATQHTVQLPPTMPAGAVIGSGGANVRLLAERSGAHFKVDRAGDTVTVSGSDSAVEAGVALLLGQIDTFLATGGSYPHPQRFAFLLARGFGDGSSNALAFARREDDAARATSHRQQLYVLQPAGGDVASLLDSSMGRTALVGSSSSSSPSSSSTELFTWAQLDEAVDTLVAAAAKGAAHRPVFDEMKLRFNFGKQLFYNGPSAATCWSIEDMRAKAVPRDYKAVYSNAVPPSCLPVLQEWLTSRGFQQTEVKQTLSLKLVHRGTNAPYSLSFFRDAGSGSGLVLRKAKSCNSKLAFLVLLLPQAGQVDWRAKLLAQYRFGQGLASHPEVLSVAASSHLVGGSSLQLPGLAEADMAVDKERHKSKTIFEGRYPPRADGGGADDDGGSTQLKVTLSRINHVGVGDVTEVAGTSPQLNALLAGLLAPGAAPEGGEVAAAAARHLRNMVAFAAVAAAVMGDSGGE